MLWHRRGKLGLRIPGPLPKLLGDQDGLFGAACNQYRDSMNEVADWARRKSLMDHTGEESIPRGVSLFEAHLYQPSRVALLQRRDGYDTDRIEVGAELPDGYEPPLRVLADLLAKTVPFTILRADEVALLAGSAKPLTFGPMERIIVQGQEGDSLFAIVEGTVEVFLRREDGTDVDLGQRSDRHRDRRDVAPDRRTAQRHRARRRRRARVRGRAPPARPDPRRAAGTDGCAAGGDGHAAAHAGQGA